MHAVVFDIDGTLLQSVAVDEELYKSAVQAILGTVWFRESLNDYDPVTDSGILAQLLVDNAVATDPDPTSQIKAHFHEALRSHIATNGPFREIPGAKEMLQSLSESKAHAVAIATGSWAESALLKLDSAGLNTPGIPVATCDDSWDRTEIMQIAVSQLGSDFESITYYGDGPWDQAACNALGWHFVPVGPVLGGLDSYLDRFVL